MHCHKVYEILKELQSQTYLLPHLKSLSILPALQSLCFSYLGFLDRQACCTMGHLQLLVALDYLGIHIFISVRAKVHLPEVASSHNEDCNHTQVPLGLYSGSSHISFPFFMAFEYLRDTMICVVCGLCPLEGRICLYRCIPSAPSLVPGIQRV